MTRTTLFRVLPMPQQVCERDGSAAMLAAKRSAGVIPEVNLRECVTHTPLPSSNEAAHSGFQTQSRHRQKSKTGVSVTPQMNRIEIFAHYIDLKLLKKSGGKLET